MSITNAMIANIVTQARATLPGAVYTIAYGDGGQQTVSGFQPDGTQNTSLGSLDGAIDGLRAEIIITLSDCAPWTPPCDGDMITIFTPAGVEVGRFTVLGHRDDPTGTVRHLSYGEDSA